MKLKNLLEQLNQLAQERPEALEMEVKYVDTWYEIPINHITIRSSRSIDKKIVNIENPFILLE
jgi:hypothetical protein